MLVPEMAAATVQRVRQMLSDRTELPYLLIPFLIPGCYWAYTSLTYPTVDDSAKPIPFSIEEIKELEGTSSTLTLPDGRKLGYSEYGSQTGRTVFYCHGLPGSRIEGAALVPMAVKLDTRIIAVDRPGYGLSSPQPGRTLLDYAKDIERLAEFIGVDSYSVLGISGGGPYALACAAALPRENLKSVSVVCGMGAPDMSKKGMNWFYWAGFTFGFAYFPGLCRWWLGREPAAQLDLSDEKRLELTLSQFLKSKSHPKDVAIAKNEGFQLYMRSSRQAFAQGMHAFAQDGRLISTDWGFRIEDIRPDLPVQLWYGKLDHNCPVIHGEQTAKRLGANAHLRVEDETHWSINVNWREQILEALIQYL